MTARASADRELAARLSMARDLSTESLRGAARAHAARLGVPAAEGARALLLGRGQPGLRTRFSDGEEAAPDFSLRAAQVGQSAETCLFDPAGNLLNESRFAAQLAALGVAAPDRPAALRDPGAELREGRPHSARVEAPLLRPVQAALDGGAGVMLDGYRDYRGVLAVGAYRYLPELRIGVLHEQDRAEAYAPLRTLEAAVVLACLGLVATLVALGTRQAPSLLSAAQLAEAETYGQYTLGRKLGEGGMGVVYEASHKLLRRPTAIKLLRREEHALGPRAEALGRFEREVQLTSQLNHPNTIVIYDYGQTDDGTFYYAMEYVDGVDLERLVRLDGPLPASRIIHLALQICGSLAEAHARGLIHRDIKPANILVCERGGVPDFIKVLDFGLVKSLHGPAVSASNVLVGTPLYMAPEMLRQPGEAGPRSDIYSLGAVLHWLATGMTVPDAAFASASLRPAPGGGRGDDARAPGDPYAGLPVDLERVIMRCIDPDPYERPASAEELARELSACRDAGRWSHDDARAYWKVRGRQLHQLLARPAPLAARTLAAT